VSAEDKLSPTLGNLFIASCCLFLSLYLIPFKFLFSKALKLMWNKEKWQLRSYLWRGVQGRREPCEQGCLQGCAPVGSPMETVLLETGSAGTLPFPEIPVAELNGKCSCVLILL